MTEPDQPASVDLDAARLQLDGAVQQFMQDRGPAGHGGMTTSMTTGMTTECPRSDLPPIMCWHCRGHVAIQVPDLDDGPDGDWPPPGRPTPIPARVGGRCRACEHPIERGELIVEGDAGWVHDECVPAE